MSEAADDPEPTRPRTRGQCINGPRPCPWVSCRHHLADVGPDIWGRLYVVPLGHGDVLTDRADAAEVDAWADRAADAVVAMSETCALDVADRSSDGASLQEIGDVLGKVSRERVRQVLSAVLDRRALRRKLENDR